MIDRFMDKVCIMLDNHGCWEWIGAVDNCGYGRISVNRINNKASRVSYSLFNGEIRKGACVMHTCDNPPCVNPGHLRVGTHWDNMRDASSKGRLKNQRKTHCKRGHPLHGRNLKVVHWGGRGAERVCLTCCRLRQRKAYRHAT